MTRTDVRNALVKQYGNFIKKRDICEYLKRDRHSTYVVGACKGAMKIGSKYSAEDVADNIYNMMTT